MNQCKNCAGCNEGLGTLSVQVNVRFIALFSRFDRSKDPVGRGKVVSILPKRHLDPAANVFPEDINALKNCAGCNEELATLSGEANVRFIALFSRFSRSKGPIGKGKVKTNIP
jgi:hypothetical protein